MWTKLGDEFSDEAWNLSDAAFRTHVEALMWSNRLGLDGMIPKRHFRKFTFSPDAEEGGDELCRRRLVEGRRRLLGRRPAVPRVAARARGSRVPPGRSHASGSAATASTRPGTTRCASPRNFPDSPDVTRDKTSDGTGDRTHVTRDGSGRDGERTPTHLQAGGIPGRQRDRGGDSPTPLRRGSPCPPTGARTADTGEPSPHPDRTPMSPATTPATPAGGRTHPTPPGRSPSPAASTPPAAPCAAPTQTAPCTGPGSHTTRPAPSPGTPANGAHEPCPQLCPPAAAGGAQPAPDSPPRTVPRNPGPCTPLPPPSDSASQCTHDQPLHGKDATTMPEITAEQAAEALRLKREHDPVLEGHRRAGRRPREPGRDVFLAAAITARVPVSRGYAERPGGVARRPSRGSQVEPPHPGPGAGGPSPGHAIAGRGVAVT